MKMIQDHMQYSLNRDHQHAKVMDIVSRLPGCGGQAADAVSAYTLVKLEDASSLLKIPKSECPDIWIRLLKHKWPNSLLSKGICTVTLWQGCYGRGNLRKSYCSTVGERFPSWECLFVNREKGLFLSVYVDDIKLAGKKTKH